MKARPEHGNAASQFLKTDGGKTKSNAIEIPGIALPKGGGAIKGIDEKFSVNAVNGTAAFSIPLPFSPARGAAPALSLSYNSGSGNGIFGLGWSLGLPSIKRKTDQKLPQYLDATDGDIFLFSEAEDLVPEFQKEPDGRFSQDAHHQYIIQEKDSPDGLSTIRYYRPRLEGLFARIERWTTKGTGRIRWRVITKENVTTLFGWSEQASLHDPLDDKRIFEWLPEFVFDDKGNCAHYLYKKEDDKGLNTSLLHHRNRVRNGRLTYTNLYLEKVLYGNQTPYGQLTDPFPPESDYLFQTILDYGEYATQAPYDKIKDWDFRTDAFSDYKAGFEIRTTRRCQRVLLFHHFTGTGEYDGLVKSLDFTYDTQTGEGFTFLTAITAVGYIKQANGAYSAKSLPSIVFDYQQHNWNKTVRTVATEDLVHAPVGLDESQYQFTDLYNEGLAGILTEHASGWWYKHNLGDGQFERAKLVSPKPSFTGLGSVFQLVDLDADGGKQLASYNSTVQGYFELSDTENWQGLRHFEQLPNVNFGDANTRLLDLNGDGRPEMLITEEDVFIWYESAGRKGFSTAHRTGKAFDEEAGPAMLFADTQQTIFLADMSGDGLSDIVRIRNGEVCYWPNLGYGRFGAKVGMDHAPVFDLPDAFQPSYLRLADIDGSGTTDLIYLGTNKCTCWMNLSGNAFSRMAFAIDAFPEIHHQSKITVTDLLGHGLSCLVWSSPLTKDSPAPLRYIDLMNGKKPHVMVAYRNNLGKEVSLEYTPSTKFYLADKLAGKPWVTKLHFPVHCISKTETRDVITGSRFITTYTYHHGYYDHPEREFRGFGLVEQTDAEHFEHWAKGNASNIVDKALHQAPVVTKQWFHTGAFLSRERILDQFAHEYWYAEMARQGLAITHHEHALPDARLIAAPGLDASTLTQLSAEEWQQALRACKGLPLRSEVFAKDAPLSGATAAQLQQERTPYSVASHNCVIELLQPKGQNQHAVFLVKESESVTYSYERDAADPRIAHHLNIKLDQYGNVLESAAVVYPRRLPDTTLPVETQRVQNRTAIIYTQHQFTNDFIRDDAYRLRLPAEVKTFELKGVNKTGAFYRVADFENILADATDVPYQAVEQEPADDTSQKRLIEHVRSLFYRNDLTAALPLYSLESKALPFETYQLAYTPGLLADIFGSKVDEALLLAGKFAPSEGDGNWWIRSGTMQFIAGGETAVQAQNRFYTPIAYIDPYDTITKVKYYGNYYLFIEETEDALGNKAKVDLFNFRILSPRRMRDPNDNLSEVITDELGLVKALAVFGKGQEADDLTGLNEFSDDGEKTLISDFFTAPDSVQLTALGKTLLQHATARFVYDFDAYQTSGKPAVVAAIMREAHFQKNNDSPVQISFEYSNGLDQVVMKKVQAEPGWAKQVVVNPDNTFSIIEVNTGAGNPQLRWIGNGRTVLNNKGNPIKQYEPYFSVTHRYEDLKELVESGVTPVMYYDAPGRLIKTELPDGTFSRVAFDSWQQFHFDVNDTVKDSDWYQQRIVLPDSDSEKKAAQKTDIHHNTPTMVVTDTLGRPTLVIGHNRWQEATGDVREAFYYTRSHLDIEGNNLSVTDARGNVVMAWRYDMLGHQVAQTSMDAGRRWIFNNILGHPVKTWDERQQEFSFEYDALHRPVKVFLRETGNPTPFLTETTEYGENQANAQANNLKGRIWRHRDGSGQITNLRFDFQGQLLEVQKQMPVDAQAPVVDWTNAVVDAAVYTQTTEYDAMSRTTRLYNWHYPDSNGQTRAAVNIPLYSRRGTLESMELVVNALKTPGGFTDGTKTTVIKDLTYDAKGQRTRVRYGNGATTCYHYDEKNFRLMQLRTTRANSETCTPLSRSNLNDPNVLQNLFYTYDPSGNITDLYDDAFKPVFFHGQRVLPQNTYTYNALYQLIEATGREHYQSPAPTQRDADWPAQNFPISDTTLRGYTQQYQYDSVGNILKMQHVAEDGSWTRHYQYAADSNRLLATETGSSLVYEPYTTTPTLADRYTYDEHGNMTRIGNSSGPRAGWDYRDMIQSYDLTGGGQAYYQYGASKERSRKYLLKNGGVLEERLYLGGLERYRRWRNDQLEEEIETLHVSEGQHRLLLVENVISTNNPQLPTGPLYRYQMGNHLDSVSLELDENGIIISYEEYHPYGTTAYQARSATLAAVAKRYRYTGMERDEETGLAYHSARYYLPWLGRWVSVDPSGVDQGINLYEFVFNNPIRYSDTNGLWGIEMHFIGVYWAGRLAGISHKDAIRAAIASQSLDDSPETAAPDLKVQGIRIGGPIGRFLTNRGNNAHALNLTRAETETVARKGIDKGNLLLLGLGLHPVGDYLPHANLSGEGTAGHQVGLNQDLSKSHYLSHGADQTYRNPEKALATFEKFRDLWTQFGQATGRIGHGPLRPLSKREVSDLADFIYARSENTVIPAIQKGLKNAGVTDYEVKELLWLANSPNARRLLWGRLDEADAKKSSSEAWDTWDHIRGGKNDRTLNSEKMDISDDLKNLPELPKDPVFEEEKIKNRQILRSERYVF